MFANDSLQTSIMNWMTGINNVTGYEHNTSTTQENHSHDTTTAISGLNNITVNNSSTVFGNDTLNSTEEYDYEYTDYSIPLEELFLVSLFYGLTFVLGAVGNSLVVFSIARFRLMQSVTNVFLLSLSTADLMVILICVPVKFAKWFTFTWEFGEFMCKAVHYLQNLSLICSVMTLTVISLERYYAILYPIQARFVCTKNKAKIAVLLIWFSSAVFASPIIAGQNHILVGEIRKGYWCIPYWPSEFFSKLYNIGMLLLVLVMPMILMSFSYISISLELWYLINKRRDNHHIRCSNSSAHNGSTTTYERNGAFNITRLRSFGSDDASLKQVIKMLMAIIVLFVICWAPTLIDNVLVAFGIVEQLHIGYLKPMRQAFVLLTYFNSCVNPMVYAFMSRNFRESFKYALCMCLNKESARRIRYERQFSFTMRSSAYSLHHKPVMVKPREQFDDDDDDDDVDLGCGITVTNLSNHVSDKVKEHSSSV